METTIEKLAHKIGEGFQSSSPKLQGDSTNIFHRHVSVNASNDLSFISGITATGLRASAQINGKHLISNYNQLLDASRKHLPLVIHTCSNNANSNAFSSLNDFASIEAIQQTGCFQLIANTPQERVYMTLIAHRIAELSLLPGIVIYTGSEDDQNAVIPADNLIIKYLGNVDDRIDCPTPSQQLIFGKTRRRIPNWYSLDTPVMMGVAKEQAALSFEAAANQEYFYNHLPKLIEQAFNEFNDTINVSISRISTSSKSGEYVVIGRGTAYKELSANQESFGEVEFVGINQLVPFPKEELKKLFQGKKAITILENTSGMQPGTSAFYNEIAHLTEDKNVKIYSGKYGVSPDEITLKSIVNHMLSGNSTMQYYVDVAFSKEKSSFPKHDILLHDIRKYYPELEKKSISPGNANNDQFKDNTVLKEVPMAVRIYQDHGPVYSRVSNFYDNTAFFYQTEYNNELVADPFTAVPLMPPATANFYNPSPKRKSVPVFDAKACTGCGSCFIQCPHSAIPPIAINTENIIKAGIGIAGSKGKNVAKLTPIIKNLAKVAAKQIGEQEVSSVNDFLAPAFDKLTVQMKLEGDKLEALQKEFSIVLDEVKNFTVSVTESLFNRPNAIEAGSGDLFSLAVDPNACTGCGICSQVCEADALPMNDAMDVDLTAITQQYQLWEQLPDTSGDSINRLYHDKEYNPLAAMLLSRSYYMSLTHANKQDKNTAYKTLLHLITATAESVIQPKMINQVQKINELIDSLSNNIHNKLSGALPKENIETLSKSLHGLKEKKLPIQQVINQISEFDKGQLVDVQTLTRKTTLVESLSNLKWIVTEGPTGTGRARYGMLLSGEDGLSWAKEYPYNNFNTPVIIHWNGSVPEESLGIFNGQLRYQLDNIKLLRRAELEAKDKYDPAIHNSEIASLSWDTLTDNEKEMISPVFLVADNTDCNLSTWNDLNKILATKWPVKVFLFNNGSFEDTRLASAEMAQNYSGVLSAITLKNAFVYQGGMGNLSNLFSNLQEGIHKSYPALFNLFVNQQDLHAGTGNNVTLSSLAINSRAFPIVKFDPKENRKFLSGSIQLEENPNCETEWHFEEIEIGGQEEKLKYTITWADWAFTLKNWKTHFNLIEKNENNIPVADFILLDVKSRKGKKPVIIRANINGLTYYSVSETVVEMTEVALSNWLTLQEISGQLTEFPDKLKKEITQTLQENYDIELAKLKEKYDLQLKEQEVKQVEIIRQKLTNKLVALSKMKQN